MPSTRSAQLALFAATIWVIAQSLLHAQEHGGGAPVPQTFPCISDEESAAIRAKIAQFMATHSAALPPPAGLQKYRFFPQAGNFWGDLFPNNFVDLDLTSPGILDYHGTAYTYNGHHGIDSDIVTFTEQSLGVPIFAALDGTVVAAHDGEFDMNTTQVSGAQANYAVLNHGGTHETWYYHMKMNSVLVSAGQLVKAGQPLGLTASSGFSTGPHLHFESRNAGTYFEAFTGPSNLGESQWADQPVFRTESYVRDFNITADNLSTWAGPPIDTTRTGAAPTGTQLRYFWAVIQSFPANSTYRFRFLRPNGTQRFDSGTRTFSGGTNPFYKWSYWWWNWNINYDVAGPWMVEFTLNGQVVVQAPLEISAGTVANRPPLPVTAALDPPLGYREAVFFCRVPHHVIDDPDYDVVRYRYEWRRNGVVIRDSTNASLADAIISGACSGGDTLTCTATPSDGALTASPVTVSTVIYQRFTEWAAANGQSAASYHADPDGDGLKNLVEYALGLPPLTRSPLPAPVRNGAGVSSWTLPLQAALDPAVSVLVETSTDLQTWQNAAPDATRTVWTAGSAADTRRLFRLRVTLP